MVDGAAAAEAIALAASSLDREAADFERLDVRTGTQSTCLVLAAPFSEPVVLKLLSPAYAHTSPLAAQREFRALERLHRATAGGGDVSVPEPLACFPDATAYLMRYVDGVPLSELAGSAFLDDGRSRTIAAALVRGLRLAHRELGFAFGDLHPGNVLVEPRSLQLTLIDPTAPNPEYAEIAAAAAFGPLAADLGYWCFSVAAVTSRLPPLASRRRRRLLRLTLALLAAAPATVAPATRRAFLDDVFANARRYGPLVRRSGPLKGRALTALLGVELALLERRARSGRC